jgi:dienelactone hydrolase
VRIGASVALHAATLLLVLVSIGVAQTPSAGYRTVRPDARGPHPAVILLSGCDGFTPSRSPTLYERRAEHLRAMGQIVVFADYLGRRGLKSCAAGAITHDDAARELMSAAAWLRAQPGVDPSRVTAMGWSYPPSCARRQPSVWPRRPR